MQLVSTVSEPTQARLSRKMGPVPGPNRAFSKAVLSVGEVAINKFNVYQSHIVWKIIFTTTIIVAMVTY